MIRRYYKRIKYRIAVKKFKNEVIAKSNLRFAGSVAACIDSCSDGRISGWIYDAKQPAAILELLLVIDGVSKTVFAANKPRPDLARELKTEGIHGFSIDVARHCEARPGRRKVVLEFNNGRTYRIGPISVENPAPVKFDASRFDGIGGTIPDRLQHIFDHITAAHEDSLRRFDEIQALLRPMGTNGYGARSALDRLPARAGSRDPRPGFRHTPGVGYFKSPAAGDDAERAMLSALIEQNAREKR